MPDAWWGWALATLATFRVAEMLVGEAGPLEMFSRLRVWTRMYDYDEDGKSFAGANAFQWALGGLLGCVYCVGVWVAGLITLALALTAWQPRPLIFYVIFWLATAGAQYALTAVVRRVKGDR